MGEKKTPPAILVSYPFEFSGPRILLVARWCAFRRTMPSPWGLFWQTTI